MWVPQFVGCRCVSGFWDFGGDGGEVHASYLIALSGLSLPRRPYGVGTKHIYCKFQHFLSRVARRGRDFATSRTESRSDAAAKALAGNPVQMVPWPVCLYNKYSKSIIVEWGGDTWNVKINKKCGKIRVKKYVYFKYLRCFRVGIFLLFIRGFFHFMTIRPAKSCQLV